MAKKFEHEIAFDKLREASGQQGVGAREYFRFFTDDMERRRNEMVSYAKSNPQTQMMALLRDWELDLLDEKSWEQMMPHLLDPNSVNVGEAGMYMLYKIFTTGNRIYSVSRHLTEALVNTDFQVDFSRIKFPFDTFIIYWGDGNTGVKLYDKYPILFQFVDVIALNNNAKQIRQIWGYIDEDGDMNNSGLLNLTVTPETKLDSDEFLPYVLTTKDSSTSNLEAKEEDRKNNALCYILLFNFLLYLEVLDDAYVIPPNPGFERLKQVSNPKKRRRIEKELKDESPYRMIYVGRKYDRRVEQASSGGSGHRLDHTTIVRGHWRHQWIGPRKDNAGNKIPGTKQKLIWIEPFHKGVGLDKDEKTMVYRVT